MLENDLTLAAMAEALAKSDDYRVLQRLIPRKIFMRSVGQSTKAGILFDVETTGLDQQKDEVIELGMVKFDYLPDGRIVGLRGIFSSFNEPSEPIPPEVTALTGITNEMVAGQRIDEAAVSSFVDDAVIVIAHNASFDRKYAERYWPIFQRKAWGCSATEVEWRKHGFEGSRLGYLLKRRRVLPPGPQGGRRLPRPARNSRVRTSDDRYAGACRPARTGPQEDDATVGRAVAFRSQRRAQAARLSLERRKRWQTAVMVRRRR
jgi:DNA polymerase III epsilon subunit-like protein